MNGTSQGAATTTNFFSSATLGNNDQVVVEGTSLEGCESASSAVSITVNPLPAVTVNAAGATTFCAGDSVMLTAITTETNYLWNTGAITQSIYVTASGNYNATVTSANNCSETSSQINVQVNALPSAPVISQSGNVLTSDALTGNQWYFNGAIIAGATSQTYTATADGSYTVIVTDANGCSSAESGPVSVIITGIEVLNSFGGLAVYPNPFSDQLIISYSLKNASKTTIELTDISGKLIAKLLDQRMTDAGEHRITLNAKDYALKNGLYLLKVSTAEGSQIVRINYIP